MKKIISPKAEFIASMLIFSTLGFFRHGVLFSSSLLVFFRALIGSAFLALLFALGRSHFAWEAVKKHKKRLAIAGAIMRNMAINRFINPPNNFALCWIAQSHTDIRSMKEKASSHFQCIFQSSKRKNHCQEWALPQPSLHNGHGSHRRDGGF